MTCPADTVADQVVAAMRSVQAVVGLAEAALAAAVRVDLQATVEAEVVAHEAVVAAAVPRAAAVAVVADAAAAVVEVEGNRSNHL